MANNLNDEIGIVQVRTVRDAVGHDHLADVAEVVAVVAAEVDVVLASFSTLFSQPSFHYGYICKSNSFFTFYNVKKE